MRLGTSGVRDSRGGWGLRETGVGMKVWGLGLRV